MKSMKKISFSALIIATTLLFLTSCSLFNGGVTDEKALEDIAGEWVRVRSNNPVNDGMVVTVVDDQGTVTAEPRSSFTIGTVKWDQIVPVDEDRFDYLELGSDGSYYDAAMEVFNDTIFITVVSTGAGNVQKYVRMSAYTDPGPSAETITLDCSGINSATELKNSAAAIDYIIPSGCVLDVTEDLTIEAGTVIQMEENSGIGVYDNGSIKALGTGAEPIVIKGADDVEGYWRGIHIETNTLDNQFDYVQVSNAGSNYVYCCNTKASVFLKGGKISMKNSTISKGAEIGLYADGNADLREFENNTITTHKGYPLAMHLERTGQLDGTDSDFSGNEKDFAFVYSGTTDLETSVSALNIPYLYEGEVFDIIVPVEYQAGVEVAFEENAGIGVYDNGSLKISGVAGNIVKFRGADAVKGFWRGIHIETSSTKNDFDYFSMSDAGGNYVYCCNTIASLYLKDGNLSMNHVTIANGASYGIATGSGFEFSEFTSNEITTHKKEPLYISLTQADMMDEATDYTGNEQDYVRINNTNLETRSQLAALNVPYLVTNGIVVDITEGLTLDPGVQLVFEENAGMGVYDNGSLNAVGTASNRISIRGKEDITGYWRGIHTETSSLSNELAYVDLKNGGGNYVYCCNDKANLFVKSGSFSLSNSTISKSGGCGVTVKAAGTLTESGNTYSDNTDGHICN
jgi:hypothetical protein